MRTPREIYSAYNIMPSLALHQLRVAAVGKMICDNFKKSISTRDVVLACLFHDMGNIIKSDLVTFPEFLEPEGLEYWKSIKTEFIRRYGSDTHRANAAIAAEVGLPANVVGFIDSAGFSRLENILASGLFELKILQYSDLRVGPHGVLSMRERLAEARERYLARKGQEGTHDKAIVSSEDRFGILMQAAHDIERQIFSEVRIKPEDITDASVAPIIEELWEYPIA